MTNLEIREYAKEKMRDRYLTAFLMVVCISFIINMISAVISPVFLSTFAFMMNSASYDHSNVAISFSFSIGTVILIVAAMILIVIISNLFDVGYRSAYLELVDEDLFEVRQIFQWFNKDGLKLVGLLMIQSLLIGLGMIFFVIPGIYLSFAFSQALYLMLDDKSLGIWECLMESKDRMRGLFGELFFLILYYYLPILVSNIVLVIISFQISTLVDQYQAATITAYAMILIFCIGFSIYYVVRIVPRCYTALAIFYRDKIAPYDMDYEKRAFDRQYDEE